MGKEFAGELTLASRGIFYGDKVPGGVIRAEPWGTKEERLLVSPNVNFQETLDRLISRLTDCPIPPGDLLLVDRQHLWFYLRCLSYGGDYSFSFQCDNCNQKVTQQIDLEKDLEVRYSDDAIMLRGLGLRDVSELHEPFTFELPLLKQRVGWRMLRGSDERAVDQYVKRMAKGKVAEERPDYLFRLAIRIVEIDGQKVEVGDALNLVEKMKGKDALEFRQQIELVDIGIDTELDVTCKNCGYGNEVIMPMDRSFFRPKRKSL